MELDEALGRITELEEQVSALAAERETLTAEFDDLVREREGVARELAEAVRGRDAAIGELAATRTAGLGYLRRALLAEHAGQCVPELIIGESEEALLASLEVAKGAYVRALETARVAIVGQTVPAGAPSARAATTAAGLSPLQLIESGLRR
jgi:hypothetical protein